MKKLLILITILLFRLIFPVKASAAAVTWDGGASTANWSDGANWSGDAVPTDADDVTINTSTTVNIAGSTTINSLTLGQNGGGTTPTLNFSYDAITSGALIIDSGDFNIHSGAILTHSIGTSTSGGTVVGTINVNVQTGNVTVTGSINVQGKGFPAMSGPGRPSVYNVSRGAGAGHGGRGGYSTANAGGPQYGSITAPITLGSGGGNASAGAGGGAVKIIATGNITITGSINANGNNASYIYGAGSGGSIFLTANTITNNGAITANGGNNEFSYAGAGGGGRISLNYTSYSQSGTLFATGNSGYGYSGAGTIYKKPSAQTYGDLIYDNNNILPAFGYEPTAMHTEIETGTFNTITIKNYAWVVISSTSNVSYTTLDWSTKGIIEQNSNSATFGNFTNSNFDLTIPSTSSYYSNVARNLNSLTVNGTLTHSRNTSSVQTAAIDLTVAGDATLSTGSTVSTYGRGWTYPNGTGTNPAGGRGAGGSHGGTGGPSTALTAMPVYGSMYEPITIGSGGGNGGGSGGGAIKLNVTGTLAVNTEINSDGISDTWDRGGGSGGSIYIIAGTLTGSSNLSADGGNGDSSYTGGGGGGRIAVYYGEKTFSGNLTVARGTGCCANTSQVGTTVLKAISGELISNPYNTEDPATLIYDLTWSETLTTGTDVKLQLRTAPDSSGSPGTWTDWMGPSGAGTYYTDPTGGEDIYSAHSDAGNDQWFQYKVILTSPIGNQNLPTFSDISVTYVVNTAPTVTITNTPTESSSGTVTVTYTLSDPEESTLATYLATDLGATITGDYTTGSTASLALSSTSYLPNSGTILLDSEMISYTGISGNSLTGITRGTNTTRDITHTAGTSVWFVASAGALTGNAGAGVSTTGSKSLTWSPGTDLLSLETTTGKLKIIANDGNVANQVGSDQVINVTLDTKAPASPAIYIDKRQARLTLSATDSNDIFYKASNNADLSADGSNAGSGSWNAFTTNPSWSFSGDPSTVYVRYKDEYGNEGTTISTVSPSRISSLMIQDASNPDTSEWRLFVSWAVGASPTNGFDYYQVYRSTDGNTYSALTQVTNQAQNYYLNTGLDSATTYYYKVTIVDDHGNESDTNYPIQTSGSSSRSGVGLTPDGSGGGDFTAPTISAISVGSITTTSATITWTTNELSDSTIGYSTNTGYANEVGSITTTLSHSVTLSNLTPNTSYYYRVISYDALNNKATAENSSTQTFTTLADTNGPTISNIESAPGETTAGITWSTSESSDSLVQYSLDTSYSNSTSSAELVQGHALTITGLTAGNTYNYKVISEDSNGNSTTSPAYTFTTTTVTTGDTTAPTISNIGVGSITSSGATISWSTNEDADGKVEYGETDSYERGLAEGNHNYTRSKSVAIIGLSPSTTYHYRIVVNDDSGNLNSTSDATFTTSAETTVDTLSDSGSTSGSSAPSITSAGPSITDISGTSATINWITTKKSNSQVYYKVKNSLDAPSSQGDVVLVTSHVVTLTNLSPATTYEYQVKSSDVNGNYVTSAKYEFTTSLPGINGIKVVSKNATEATITWTTAVPTTTVVEYADSETKVAKRYSNSSLVTAHKADLGGLYPATLYAFTVLITDEAGNLARSDQYSFTTGEDKVGPTISNINNRSTIVAGQNKVQTVITWTTDEPTTSQVEYSLGSGSDNYDQKTLENPDFVSNHIMVIANLKPGSVYRYRVVSRDRGGNSSNSEAYALLTPQKEVSALDLIIQNLQSSFGWIRNINN